MKPYLAFLFLMTVCLAEETTWGVLEEDHVAILTDATFDDFIKSHVNVFVNFYTPDCGSCKAMEPQYTSLAKNMKRLEIPIAKVDLSVNKELASRFGVEGLPLLVSFRNGYNFTYKGKKTEDDMMSYLASKKHLRLRTITKEIELLGEESKGLSLVYFIDKSEPAKHLAEAIQIAYPEIPLSICYDAELKNKYDPRGYVLVLYRNFDSGKKMMITHMLPNFDDIKVFINTFRFPIVMNFDEKTAERIFSIKRPVMIFLADNSISNELSVFKEFAKEHSNEMFFAYSPITEGFGTHLAQFLSVSKKDEPAIRIMDFENNSFNKYKISSFDIEGMKKALTDYKEGKLKHFYKSEPLPVSNDQPVKVVVGDSLDDMVLNNDKFVLLEIYAPWCGHCQKLEPIYQKLGDLLASEPDLVIAKMDGTVNEHSTFTIQNFPTIYFYKIGSKNQPELYNGPKEFDAMIKYLEEKLGRKLGVEQTSDEL